MIQLYVITGLLHGLLLYDLGKYDCRQMSRDFEDCVESIGIPVDIVRGENGDDAHVWVSIYGIEFDSVFLLPFPNHMMFPENISVYEEYEDYLNRKV